MSNNKIEICPVCGKEFVKNSPSHKYCGEVCKLSAQYDIKETRPLPPEIDLKIKDILNIMREENIAYSQYAHSNETRKMYIERYKGAAVK